MTTPKPERLTEVQKAKVLDALRGTELHGPMRDHFHAEDVATDPELCCEMLKEQLKHSCVQHPNPYDCPDSVILKTKRGWGLPIHDGSHSYISITYCPFCGKRLP